MPEETAVQEASNTDALRELGFTKAAQELDDAKELARKYRIAAAHYKAIRPKHITAYNEKLRKRTEKTGTTADRMYYETTYQKLQFTPVKDYPRVPPGDVLISLRKARDLACFDDFEICTPYQVMERKPDPALLGVIKGCPDKFWIDSWDSDVKLEDLLG